MPPQKSIQSIHILQYATHDLQSLAQHHSGNLPIRYSRFQPYAPSTHLSRNTIPDSHFTLPPILVDKIRQTQEAATSRSTQTKDAKNSLISAMVSVSIITTYFPPRKIC